MVSQQIKCLFLSKYVTLFQGSFKDKDRRFLPVYICWHIIRDVHANSDSEYIHFPASGPFSWLKADGEVFIEF